MEHLYRAIHRISNIRDKKSKFENGIEVKRERELTITLPLDDTSTDERILDPFKYLMSRPSKHVRENCVAGLNYWLKAPENACAGTTELFSLVHNLSLMFDDIQDNSALRRGIPCSHRIFGIYSTLNTVGFVSVACMKAIIEFKNPDVTDTVSEIIHELILGQATEVYWRDNYICPTEEEYKSMTMRKTGAVFLGGFQILKIYSQEKVNANRLLTALALYFQINDDYINLASEEYHKLKGFCDDITEGKFSFPIIYAIQNFPEQGKTIMNILRQRTRDMKQLERCLSIIQNCGALEYTRQVLQKYKNIIKEEKEKLGPNPILEERIFGPMFNSKDNLMVA